MAEPVEQLGERRRPRRPAGAPPRRSQRRNYKIQEVIKRRQVMLVQVVKEERGNKGAALTTYLSLAGRYSVLMPNTARGGGISRKITNAADRKRLKDIVGDLEVPQGQGIILRTAGASRTKAEVKRDFEYLQRLWENVRTLTLKSTAPCLVYEEGSLIKRTIRDLYYKDIDEVLVAGEDAYREAKDFMRMIMPSHAKNVQLYKEDQPLFSKFQRRGPARFRCSRPQVTLPSGGYIVINPTEALVSIDVNSGRSTKEHNIEDTALQTNLEAAEEISRQLRLRDLAGLIVIDFIDMDREPLQPGGRAQAQGLPQERPRPHPGRPHQPFRPDGNEPPAHPLRRRRKLDPQVPDLRGHRPRPLGREPRADGHARDRGPRAAQARPVDQRHACRPTSRSTSSTPSATPLTGSKPSTASRSPFLPRAVWWATSSTSSVAKPARLSPQRPVQHIRADAASMDDYDEPEDDVDDEDGRRGSRSTPTPKTKCTPRKHRRPRRR